MNRGNSVFRRFLSAERRPWIQEGRESGQRPISIKPLTVIRSYLIIAGSLICFTAFVWLLGRMPASKVASHAYVNPIVALALGHFLASEQVNLRTLLGAALVIGSVFLTMKEE
jgi:drug/metabolite transporter (DMT)-like permease